MMKKIFGILFLILLLSNISYASNSKEWSVGGHSFEPCVMKNKDKSYTGFEYDLLKEVSNRNNVELVIQDEPFKDILTSIQTKEVDIGMAGISITSERIKNGNIFSYPTINSGLQAIMIGKKDNVKIVSVIVKQLFTIEILKLLLSLVGVLSFWAILLWLAEQGHDVIRDGAGGIGDALWCVWAQITTIGFGDIVPKSHKGKMLSIPIFFTGCCIVATVMGPIVSAFTVREIDGLKTNVKSISELKEYKVGTKLNTTSMNYLEENNFNVIGYTTEKEMYSALILGEVQAVIFDEVNILYNIKRFSKFNVKLVGEKFNKQDYGFLLNSLELKKVIDTTILDLKEDGTYDIIYNKYFN